MRRGVGGRACGDVRILLGKATGVVKNGGSREVEAEMMRGHHGVFPGLYRHDERLACLAPYSGGPSTTLVDLRPVALYFTGETAGRRLNHQVFCTLNSAATF